MFPSDTYLIQKSKRCWRFAEHLVVRLSTGNPHAFGEPSSQSQKSVYNEQTGGAITNQSGFYIFHPAIRIFRSNQNPIVMGTYINVKCPHCGHSFTGGYRLANYSKLGTETVHCSSCFKECKTGQKPYSKMSQWDRMYVWGTEVVLSIIYGALPGALVAEQLVPDGGFGSHSIFILITGGLFFLWRRLILKQNIEEIENKK